MVKPNAEVMKAKQAVKAATKGTKQKVRKVRLTPHFSRPKTQILPKKPMAPRRLLKPESKLDEFRIIQSALSTEAAVRKIEQNTLTFLCDPQATKPQIRAAVLARFGCKAVKVNTLIRPDGKKKAYVRLGGHQDVSDLATRLSII